MQTYLPPDDDQTQRTPPELRLLIVLLGLFLISVGTGLHLG
jgi:hypothetical protein